MDARDFKEETRTEDSGGDIEEFIAILERMKALKKVRREGISRDRSEEGQRKIVGGWMPSFEWEDFCDDSGNGDGGVKMQEERGGVKAEAQGPKKRLREDVKSSSRKLKADIFDPEESKLALAVGLPAFSFSEI